MKIFQRPNNLKGEPGKCPMIPATTTLQQIHNLLYELMSNEFTPGELPVCPLPRKKVWTLHPQMLFLWNLWWFVYSALYNIEIRFFNNLQTWNPCFFQSNFPAMIDRPISLISTAETNVSKILIINCRQGNVTDRWSTNDDWMKTEQDSSTKHKNSKSQVYNI